jgi:hypothetical protein
VGSTAATTSARLRAIRGHLASAEVVDASGGNACSVGRCVGPRGGRRGGVRGGRRVGCIVGEVARKVQRVEAEPGRSRGCSRDYEAS